MIEQHHLDFDRKDVLAARDEHVLAAVDEGDEAIVVLPRDVAGAEPAIGGEGAGRLVRPVPVARCDIGAGQPYLARLAGGDVMAVVVDDAQADSVGAGRPAEPALRAIWSASTGMPSTVPASVMPKPSTMRTPCSSHQRMSAAGFGAPPVKRATSEVQRGGAKSAAVAQHPGHLRHAEIMGDAKRGIGQPAVGDGRVEAGRNQHRRRPAAAARAGW